MSDQTPPPYPGYPVGDNQPDQPWGTPPQSYGQPPAYGRFAAPDGHAPIPFASWGARVGGYILDGLVGAGVIIVPLVIGIALSTSTSSGTSAAGGLILVLGYVLALGFQIWNVIIRQGRTGQSLGKKWVGIQVVRDDNGQFLGAGASFGRWLMLVILTAITCYLNLLWPLWDVKKQALHDKVVGSVVLTK